MGVSGGNGAVVAWYPPGSLTPIGRPATSNFDTNSFGETFPGGSTGNVSFPARISGLTKSVVGISGSPRVRTMSPVMVAAR